jgi:hypothetical protein
MDQITRESLVRVIGTTCGAALALVGLGVWLNEVIFHGFPFSCSDGHPDYDPEVCGPTWGAGIPSLAVAALGVVLGVLSARWRRRA